MHYRTARRIARKYGVKRLVTQGNPKTAKGEGYGYLTAVLHLAPADLSGRNVCPMAELAGCIAGCLNTAGRGGIAAGNATFMAPNGDVVPDNRPQHARLNRTRFYHAERGAFMTMLAGEIATFSKLAKRHGLAPTIRLNGTSDIRFEVGHLCEHGGTLYQSIFHAFPEIRFYDYTKIANRRNLPENYSLTWSYSEASSKYAAMMPEGLNTAVVFRTPRGQALPRVFKGRRVIDGDAHDLRFLDPRNVIVGLRAKGRARHDRSGFVIDPCHSAVAAA